jgi:hypothetical protein
MITDSQLHILQHSLGVDRHGRGNQYRNRFVTGPDCDSYADCQALVTLGFMTDHGVSSVTGGMHLFTVTPSGCKLVPPAPKLTRNQRRYLDFLGHDQGLDFREWLRLGLYRRVTD